MHFTSTPPDYWPSKFREITYPIGVKDFTLLHDQPEYLAGGYEWWYDGTNNEAYDLYLVSHIALTDQNFSENGIHLPLLLPESYYRYHHFCQAIPDYDFNKYGPEVHAALRCDLLVKCISKDAYIHFRDMILQNKGIDFFTEPVYLPGNIQNGYGCFSVSNTQRLNFFNTEAYKYPERHIYESEYENNNP